MMTASWSAHPGHDDDMISCDLDILGHDFDMADHDFDRKMIWLHDGQKSLSQHIIFLATF